MQRREFLKLSGLFSVSILTPFAMTGCGSNSARAAGGEVAFLHGVASADPRPASVVLWTRITPLQDTSGYVDVSVQIASDENFENILSTSSVRIDESSDYTLRFSLRDLSSDTIYYYRFITKNNVVSPIGRTWTAPIQSDNIAINFASVNCQNREHGFYTAYALMLQEDVQKTREQQIRFVLHLGDFIYETRLDPLQRPIDADGNSVDALIDANGVARTINNFPDGAIDGDIVYANTLADYRYLYRSYLLDPYLQAARARWPFVCVWDDHEFSDDCWQTEANYRDSGYRSSTNEPSQPRKLAANQAWYEYVPADYSVDPGDDETTHHSHEFRFSSVGITPNTEFNSDGLAANVDNLASINSLTIYRSLHFGKLLQIVLTDCRSYRSDHPVPEDISGNFSEFFHSRVALPLALVNVMDAGREANNGNPPVWLDLPAQLLNPRYSSPPGSMLGAKQKTWWKEVFSRSNSQWKVWSNSVPLMRLAIDLSALGENFPDIVMSSDTWDGYSTERRELLSFLHANDITNVVSIAGDLHAHYAGRVSSDHDQAEVAAKNIVPEFVCGAISSVNQFTGLNRLSARDNPDEIESLLRSLIIYMDKVSGKPVCNFNTAMLRGVKTAQQAAQQADSSLPVANTTAPLNPHLAYADTDAHGYGLFRAEAEKMLVEFVSVDGINVDPQAKVPQVLRKVRFEVPAQTEIGEVDLQGPIISGAPPYPLR